MIKWLLYKIHLFWVVSGLIFFSFIIGVTLFDRVLMPYFIHGPEVIVPLVTEMTEPDAVKILEQHGLRPIIENRLYDDAIPPGQVTSQLPGAGKKIRTERKINLIISLGGERVKVPSLSGESVREAEIKIKRNGLLVGRVERVFSDSIAEDIVISNFPLEATVVIKESRIDLLVSKGPVSPYLSVPNFVGIGFEDAEVMLKNYGLVLGKKEYRTKSDFLPETVTEQSLAEGTRVLRGSVIDFLISK